MSRGAQLLAGLLLLAGAGVVDRAAPRSEAADASRASEPIALTLASLGPVKAIVSSMLWVVLAESQAEGDERRVATIARALLQVHPGLAVVREYLANQLIVTEAPYASTPERHDALVMLGLSLLADGIELTDNPRLHSAMGRTLHVQRMVDERFVLAAERFLGASVEDIAIDALARSEASIDAWLRADLLVERGMDAAGPGGNRWSAIADLEEAERALAGLGPLDETNTLTARRMLQPLRDALDFTLDWRTNDTEEDGSP
jgi:hypothetical protein